MSVRVMSHVSELCLFDVSLSMSVCLMCVCVVQTPAEGTDANIQYSYLVNKSVDGSGDGSLSVLGQTYANFPC